MLRVLVVALLLGGCVAHRTGDAVKSVSFTVEGRPFPKSLVVPESDHALVQQMSQRASSWQSLVFPGAVGPRRLDRSGLNDDGEALELWFVEQGYLDAQFLRWEITRHGRKHRRMHPVSVHGFIDEGPASHLRTITVDGLDNVRPRLAERLRVDLPLALGRMFTTTDDDAALPGLRNRLLGDGYAFEKVTGSADAFP